MAVKRPTGEVGIVLFYTRRGDRPALCRTKRAEGEHEIALSKNVGTRGLLIELVESLTVSTVSAYGQLLARDEIGEQFSSTRSPSTRDNGFCSNAEGCDVPENRL